MGDVEQGVQDLEHGLRISPQDSRLAMWGAFHAAGLAQLGRLDEALEQTRIACRRDPRAYMPRVIQALVLVLLGQKKESRAALAAALEIRPRLAVEEMEILLGPLAAPLQPVWESLAVPRRVHSAGAGG